MRIWIFTAALGVAACSGETTDEAAPQNESPSAAETAVNGPDLRLYAMDCGRITMGDLSLFSSDGEYEGREPHDAAVMCFLIRHAQGDLLWDSGLPDAFNDAEDGVLNGPFTLSVPVPLLSQLKTIGVAPEDIEYYTISHSHFDHVGNSAMVADATLLIDADERAYMFRDDARADAETFGLVAPLEDAPTQSFEGDLDVFGDGSVVILDMPGHTPGHKSLLVNLENAGPVLLSGDLYHLIESRAREIVPSFNTDEAATRASFARFEQIAEDTGARVVIQHSLEHMDALPLAPKYLD
ncbi:MAG: N-acyl homoserine lactonase family protein [Pseudomonadota bacterium]